MASIDDKIFPAIADAAKQIWELREAERVLRASSTYPETLAQNYEDLGKKAHTYHTRHKRVLRGTPEEDHLKRLVIYFGHSSKVNWQIGAVGKENVLDIRIEDLKYPKDWKKASLIPLFNRLHEEGIKYLGQLVQKTPEELRPIPNLGRLRVELLETMAHMYGKKLGMHIKYAPPEQRT